MKKIIKVAVISLMVIGFIKPVCAEEMNGFGNPPEWVEKENESRNREKERGAKNHPILLNKNFYRFPFSDKGYRKKWEWRILYLVSL